MDHYKPLPIITSPDQCCSVCSKIDILGLMKIPADKFQNNKGGFQVAIWPQFKQDIANGSTQVAMWPQSRQCITRKDCILCRIFASISNDDGNPQQQLRAFTDLPEGSGMYSESRRVNSSKRSAIAHLFFVMLRDPIAQEWRMKKHEMVRHGFIVPQSMDARIVNRVNTKRADFELLCSWLLYCKRYSRECQRRIEQEPRLTSFNLIDCKSRKILPIPVCSAEHFPYLALSYVWGDSDRPRFQVESYDEPYIMRGAAALDSAPRTVKDAMIATRKLGYRYLWVDQFCIYNNSYTDELIRKMHLIYGNADATIVALEGDQHHGLYGVTDVERFSQMGASFGNLELLATLPEVREAIMNSEWNNRGWTYQEARLSRRLFFFSKYQVYYVCNCDCRSEAVHATSSTVFIALNWYRIDADLIQDKIAGEDILVLDRYVYSNRDTKTKDRLDAFRGVLARSSWTSFWGVTITFTDADFDCYDGFAMGLSWMRTATWAPHLLPLGDKYWDKRFAKVEQHKRFPSWTWASIMGPIFFDRHKPETNIGSYLRGKRSYSSLENLSKLSIWIKDETHGWQVLSEAIKNRESNLLKETSRKLLIEGDLVKVWTEKQKKPTTRKKKSDWQPQNDIRWSFEGIPGNLSKLTPWSPDHLMEDDWSLAVHDALVLMHWRDRNQSISQRRFILIVLEEVESAELEHGQILPTYKRLGMLSSSQVEWEAAEIAQIAKERTKLFLI